MKIDLFKLNNFNELNIDDDIVFPEEYYDRHFIRNTKNLHIKGNIAINIQDEIVISATIDGVLVLECAITLEDVDYPINMEIEENIGNFEDFYNKNKNSLDILPIIWENIVSEVPIKVVKEGLDHISLSGDGWKFETSNE